MRNKAGKVSLIVLGVVVIFVIAIGALWFVESRQNSAAGRVGQKLKTALQALGPRFADVKVRYSVGGGIIAVQFRPMVTGKVRSESDRQLLEQTVDKVCAEMKSDRIAITGIKVMPEGSGGDSNKSK
ncbi:MAG: hypothetical protein V1701_11580 [Planctomycetota bacterium]